MRTDQITQGAAVAVLEPGYASYDTERAVLADAATRVVPVPVCDDLVPRLSALDPVAILVRETPVGAAEMAACPGLRVIVRYGVGVDNVDLDHARQRGIYVANVPDYGAEIEVSEHALALYLAVQHRLVSRDREVREGRWGIGQAAEVPSRENAVLGLVGCGRIGREAERKFRAIGFGRVLAYDPFLDAARAAEAELEIADLGVLCAEADVISLHAPLTDDTRHMIGAEMLARMKPTSIVVNVSRGGLVDEAALAAALTEGRIFGAGIDVFETEPVAPDNPLLAAPNCIVSDHTAWYSERSVEVLQRKAAEAVRDVLEGRAPKAWVNRW